MALANNGRAIGVHRNPHPGGIDRQETAAVFTGQDAFGFERLRVPGVEPEDSVGFRNRVPSFDIGQFAAMGLTRADMAVIKVAP